MAQKPSMIPLVVIGGAAVAALIGFTYVQNNSDPKIIAEKQKEAARAQNQKEADKSAGNQPKPPGETTDVPGANELAMWGARKTLGKPGGKPEITVTWAWTPTVQGNPGAIYAAVASAKKALPDAAITVVNQDASGGNSPLGITVDGSLRLPAQTDGTFPPEQAIVGALKSGQAPP